MSNIFSIFTKRFCANWILILLLFAFVKLKKTIKMCKNFNLSL